MTPIHALSGWRSARAIRFGFTLIEEDGVTRSIPYHRVRAVWRDGVMIWSRKSRAAAIS
jgi:uncharacterized protein (UPF0248 family)